METLAELRLREEGRVVGHNQTERNIHPPGNSELAKQEILAGEQQLGEKTPGEYMREEKNSQLLFQQCWGIG